MHPAWRRARVLIADAEAPVVQVYDVEFEELVEPVELPEPAQGLTLADGAEYLLVSGPTSVTPVYVGVSILDHSEGAEDSDVPHLHVYKYPPTPVAVDLPSSAQPLVGAFGRELAIATPSGDTFSALRFQDSALLDPETFEPTASSLPLAALDAIVPVPSGFVVLAGDVLSIVSPDLVPAERMAASAPCAGGFGPLAHAADRAILGCADGVALVSVQGSAASLTRLGSRRPTSVALHVDRPEIVVADGSASLERFQLGDSGAEGALSPLVASAEVCDVLFEPGHGDVLLTLSSDGAVRTLDAESGEELALAALTGSFACDDSVRPRLAAIPARAYVLLPEQRELVELWVDAELRELTRTTVPGAPRALVTAGLDLETRNLGDLSDVE
jgi:hypothetical protein